VLQAPGATPALPPLVVKLLKCCGFNNEQVDRDSQQRYATQARTGPQPGAPATAYRGEANAPDTGPPAPNRLNARLTQTS
jgi:hypothetical protein